MENTGRKEMRKLLNRAQALQKLAFDNGLDFNLGTRLKEKEDRPWLTGNVYEETADFTIKEDEGVRYRFFYVYEWMSVEDNNKTLDAVEEFINNHIK